MSFITVCQRRVGLYLSVLASALNEREARGFAVSQHERLGDAAVNDANQTHRHNAGLHAVYSAIRHATPARNAVRLGDRGDGSASSRAEARARQSYLNAGHIPDLYILGPPHTLFEWKSYSPFTLHNALGLGSTRCGGAASTSDGHTYAFGNTLEHLRVLVLGTEARGAPTDPPFNRVTGEGRVDYKPGDYADALAKGSKVRLLATESTGALSSDVIDLLRALAKASTTDGVDTTPYGTARTSPRDFFSHHIAAISTAIVLADALAITNHAASLHFNLTNGILMPCAATAAPPPDAPDDQRTGGGAPANPSPPAPAAPCPHAMTSPAVVPTVSAHA